MMETMPHAVLGAGSPTELIGEHLQLSVPLALPCTSPLEKTSQGNQGSPQRKEDSHEMGLTVAFGVT